MTTTKVMTFRTQDYMQKIKEDTFRHPNRATTSTLDKKEGILERIKERELSKRGKSVASKIKPTPFLYLKQSNTSNKGDYDQV